MLIVGAIGNARANATMWESATARRWTPTVAFVPNGGQVGLRLQF